MCRILCVHMSSVRCHGHVFTHDGWDVKIKCVMHIHYITLHYTYIHYTVVSRHNELSRLKTTNFSVMQIIFVFYEILDTLNNCSVSSIFFRHKPNLNWIVDKSIQIKTISSHVANSCLRERLVHVTHTCFHLFHFPKWFPRFLLSMI